MALKDKIFGIGLHKTGTTTLRECLRLLGFSVCPEEFAYLTREATASGKYRSCLRLAFSYDAFEDAPWNYQNVYRVLDAVFPTARFILTSRDQEAWFRSILRWCCLHDSGSDINLVSTLGTSVSPEAKKTAQAAYRAHNSEVADYFGGRPGKLLVVDWEAGDGWTKVCEFVGKPVPNLSFPHLLKYDPAISAYMSIRAKPLEKKD